jgi:hypothetical protein
MDFSDEYSRSAPWEKVMQKVVDPITFSCTATVEYLPRLEECSYETTGPAHVEPRFGSVYQRTTRNGIDAPSWTPPSSRTPVLKQRKKLVLATSSNFNNGDGDGKTASLGAFFQKSSNEKLEELENMSLGSKSMNSRSIADLSTAERSKTEDKLKRKAKERKGQTRRGSKKNAMQNNNAMQTDMESIMEDSAASFDYEVKSVSAHEPSKSQRKPKSNMRKPQGKLGQFLETEEDEDERSLNLEEAVEPRNKKLRFKDGHEEFEVARITDSMYDDLFYTSEELADFRYEAFLVEAGLDVEEYM